MANACCRHFAVIKPSCGWLLLPRRTENDSRTSSRLSAYHRKLVRVSLGLFGASNMPSGFWYPPLSGRRIDILRLRIMLSSSRHCCIQYFLVGARRAAPLFYYLCFLPSGPSASQVGGGSWLVAYIPLPLSNIEKLIIMNMGSDAPAAIGAFGILEVYRLFTKL